MQQIQQRADFQNIYQFSEASSLINLLHKLTAELTLEIFYLMGREKEGRSCSGSLCASDRISQQSIFH